MAFKLAIAQLHSLRNKSASNMEKHIRIATEAANNRADILVFPELSLTGYERKLASSQAFSINDQRLQGLVDISRLHNMVVVVGAPIKDDGLYIGSLVLMPDGTRKVYYKNNLHEGEELYFTSGSEALILKVKEEKIALSICYDIEVETHFKSLANEATLYISSIFYSPKGMVGLKEKIKTYSQTYKLDIGISNFVGDVWENKAGGMSLLYSKHGKCVSEASSDQETLVIYTKSDDTWSAKVIAI
ncbi:MAG: carbon-nitrogen hydrolase family protein [Clostridiales bacterium]|nr:carbon-nitrogen hydrolase family protein [Clostridiales bacterium]